MLFIIITHPYLNSNSTRAQGISIYNSWTRSLSLSVSLAVMKLAPSSYDYFV
jgi:hypothetical protein